MNTMNIIIMMMYGGIDMDKHEKKFSQYDIYNIIDKRIKREMELKNEYIQKNGYKHKDIINRFDTAIATLSMLYREFDLDGTY